MQVNETGMVLLISLHFSETFHAAGTETNGLCGKIFKPKDT